MQGTIKEYWDNRAEQYAGNPAATTNDIYLRELEISSLIETLKQIDIPENASVLDLGCGNGYSTIKVAEAFPGAIFLGIDYSENMIASANKLLQSSYPQLKNRVKFVVGDATKFDQICGNSLYDAVYTDRCLINLSSPDSQYNTIAKIAEHTKPGGYYIAIENFIEGQQNMNRARCALGLPEIPVRWHNLYFEEAEFVSKAGRFFAEIKLEDFSSSYYFATRVIYSAACQMRGEQPDYSHEIHQLAPQLPWVGQFSPIRMAILHKQEK